MSVAWAKHWEDEDVLRHGGIAQVPGQQGDGGDQAPASFEHRTPRLHVAHRRRHHVGHRGGHRFEGFGHFGVERKCHWGLLIMLASWSRVGRFASGTGALTLRRRGGC
jgi:hypothetical protein